MRISIHKISAAFCLLLGTALMLPAQTSEEAASFSLTVRKAKADTKGNASEEHWQLWGENAGVYLKLLIEPTTNRTVPVSMTILTNPNPKLWEASMLLSQVKIKEGAPQKGKLWDEQSKWQMGIQWWDNNNILRKYVRSAAEMPTELAKLELALSEVFARDGLIASNAFPKRGYVGMRWMNAPVGIKSDENLKINKPSEELDRWLSARITKTPQLVFQIVRREVLPSLSNRPWRTFAFKLSNDKTILLDVFELPNR